MKKKYLMVVASVALLSFSNICLVNQVDASGAKGGQITTEAKITFKEIKSDKKLPSTSPKTGKEGFGGNKLPATGELKKNYSKLIIGWSVLILTGTFFLFRRRNEKEAGN